MLLQLLCANVQLLREVCNLVRQDLDQSFTIYLNFTFSLRPAVIQPYRDVPVRSVRAQRTTCYPLPDSVGADVKLLRRLPYETTQRPAIRPASVRSVVRPPSVNSVATCAGSHMCRNM